MNALKYPDDRFLMLSALSHYLYCPRRCALVHVDRRWEENRFTAEGEVFHERVDAPGKRSSPNVKLEYAVPLRSERLGVVGRADVVEYRLIAGRWRPFPVEYKRGEPKENRCDEVQLCAQAICLEEMTGFDIPEGALFYGKTQHRFPVFFDAELRELTTSTAAAFHRMVDSGDIPPPTYERKKCDHCSLVDYCMPRTGGLSAARYIQNAVQ